MSLADLFPTKANLIQAKKSLKLAKQGYELMDRKRNILIREMMSLVDKSKQLQGEIEQVYVRAYAALQKANISLGIINDIVQNIPEEDGINIRYRSIMGVDIPILDFDERVKEPNYGFAQTNSQFDIAYACFNRAKNITVVLAEIENSVYRIADAIKKTSRRANALKNVTIPKFENTVNYISAALEEKEREEFSRLKVIRSKAVRKI